MVASSSDSDKANRDLELGHVATAHLANDAIHSFAWNDLAVRVKDRVTKKQLTILTSANGIVHQGEMLAIMGPSGSGKTTLLNALADRKAAAGATTTGDILANGQPISHRTLRQLSTYVEQEDALIGSLTVKETMKFAAGLALSGSTSRKERERRVQDLIASFGMQDQAHTIVGTPIKKGLSGGQKKRLGVASQLVTGPRIVFLDEPTSGLDSALSYEVINYIKEIAKKNKLIVIASIHQPSTSTFKLFDKLCLLSKGKICYFGSLPEAHSYFDRIGFAMPLEINPAEYYLELINTDLATPGDEVYLRAQDITGKWTDSTSALDLRSEISTAVAASKSGKGGPILSNIESRNPGLLTTTGILLHRSWIKSYRDVVVYGIRVAMYLGLAILMGTVFLRLNNTQENIQPFINAIFFGGAFMSFMAVAYVPAFLEDFATFRKERANGLVGPMAFNLANFIIGLPFLFAIAALFSVVVYFLTGFNPTAQGFFRWTLWLFLDLLAAEALVVLVSTIFPIFVLALAVTAFANGLWMCVDGFLVPMNLLNPFWKYVFHYIDYQAYVFQGMMVNEFQDRIYTCAEAGPDNYFCMYPSDLNSQGEIRGASVLETFGISVGKEAQWIGISIAIIAGYRILAYLVLRFRS